MDRLKGINDVHGHLVGSRMLSELGRLIGRNIRDCDLAARYGGDEFVIILPQTGKQQAVSLAEKLLELMRSTDSIPTTSRRSISRQASELPPTRRMPAAGWSCYARPTSPCTMPKRPAETASRVLNSAASSLSIHRLQCASLQLAP